MSLTRRCALGAGLVLLVLAIGVGALVWRIQSERNLAFLREHVLSTMQAGLGPDNRLALASAGLALSGLSPTFSLEGLSISNPETGAAAELERADLLLSRGSLVRLAPEAKAVRFTGLRLVLPAVTQSKDPLNANEVLTLLRAILASVHVTISGQDPTFAELSRIEGSNITILRRMGDGGTQLVRDGLTVTLLRKGVSDLTAQLGRAGEASEISLAARANPAADGGRMIELESGAVPAGSLFQILGGSVPGIDPALKVVARVIARVDADNRTLDTVLSLSARDGVIHPLDPDMLPFRLDEGRLDLRFLPDTARIAIDRLAVRFGETDFLASGSLEPDEAGGGAIRVRMESERAVIGRLSAEEPLVALTRASLSGRIGRDLLTLDVERFAFGAGNGAAELAGRFSLAGEGLVSVRFEASGFDLRSALRIWPIWIAPNVRTWFVEHAGEGKVAQLAASSHLVGEVLRAAQEKRPIPDEAMRVTYRLENATLKPFADALAVTGITAEGLSTGRKAQISVPTGRVQTRPGEVVELTGAEFTVADTAQKPAILEATLPVKGQLSSLLAFLSAPSLRGAVGAPQGLAVAAGSIEGRATLRLPLGGAVTQKDARIEMRADMRNVVIDNIVRDEKLEDGAFSLASRAGQVLLKGDARLGGVPAQIEVKGEAAKAPRAQVKLALDDAQLARKGIDLRPTISGPMAVTIAADLDGRPGQSFEIEADLQRAKVDAAGIPGLAKRAGQPGRAKFTQSIRQDTTVLDNLELEIGAVSARGRVEIQRGQLSRAELSAIKFSPGDNARLTIERPRNLFKIALKGNSFDLRPFLKSAIGGKIEGSKDGPGPDFDLELDTTVLVGFNGELMSGASARAQRRQGRLAQLALSGRFGAQPISASTPEASAESANLKVETADAGALFRFLDLYPRAFGGQMTADLSISAEQQRGVVLVRDFEIRGEPALKQASGTVASQAPDRPAIIVGDVTRFEKLRAQFVRRPGRLELQEAVMWGAAIGGSIEGTIDYARDTVSLKGAFVPAYALNNLFAQVPIIGRILGGGQYEGLFAVPFVITGKASQPLLRINPVSAIAPGFLRKFFEIQREK